MNVCVVGYGHLAQAARGAVSLFFDLASPFPSLDVPAPDVVWFCENTPVDDDHSDLDHLFAWLGQVVVRTANDTPILISSQVPVGFYDICCKRWPGQHFAIVPENIRRAHAIHDFVHQDRIVVGNEWPEDCDLIAQLLSPFTDRIVWMNPRSAECVKHALNGFLAMEIAYANELADFCRDHGADIEDVWKGWTSDRRVGTGPLQPIGPYTGGTLGRDVQTMIEYGGGPLIRAIRESNDMQIERGRA